MRGEGIIRVKLATNIIQMKGVKGGKDGTEGVWGKQEGAQKGAKVSLVKVPVVLLST